MTLRPRGRLALAQAQRLTLWAAALVDPAGRPVGGEVTPGGDYQATPGKPRAAADSSRRPAVATAHRGR